MRPCSARAGPVSVPESFRLSNFRKCLRGIRWCYQRLCSPTSFQMYRFRVVSCLSLMALLADRSAVHKMHLSSLLHVCDATGISCSVILAV